MTHKTPRHEKRARKLAKRRARHRRERLALLASLRLNPALADLVRGLN